MGLKYISVLFIYEIRTIVTKLPFTLRCPLFTVSYQCYDFDLTSYHISIHGKLICLNILDWYQSFLWKILWMFKEFCLYIHNKDIYKVLQQEIDDWNIQSNLRRYYSKKVFKNWISKKEPKSANLHLDICYNNTQNTFLNHLNCEQVWAIVVFLFNIFIMKCTNKTNISF